MWQNEADHGAYFNRGKAARKPAGRGTRVSSWSCPHLDMQADWCRRLKAACVLGRKGCILPRTLRFANDPQGGVPAAGAKAAPPPRPADRKPG